MTSLVTSCQICDRHRLCLSDSPTLASVPLGSFNLFDLKVIFQNVCTANPYQYWIGWSVSGETSSDPVLCLQLTLLLIVILCLSFPLQQPSRNYFLMFSLIYPQTDSKLTFKKLDCLLDPWRHLFFNLSTLPYSHISSTTIFLLF